MGCGAMSYFAQCYAMLFDAIPHHVPPRYVPPRHTIPHHRAMPRHATQRNATQRHQHFSLYYVTNTTLTTKLSSHRNNATFNYFLTTCPCSDRFSGAYFCFFVGCIPLFLIGGLPPPPLPSFSSSHHRHTPHTASTHSQRDNI